jgi:hypothetical protein
VNYGQCSSWFSVECHQLLLCIVKKNLINAPSKNDREMCCVGGANRQFVNLKKYEEKQPYV